MPTTPLKPDPVYVLNWESYAECKAPAQLPDGWRPDLPPQILHPNNEPAFRIACPPEPVHSGQRSARFQLNKGDDAVSSGARAELKTLCCDDLTDPTGSERWYGFSLYLPSDWDTDNKSGEILTQWHQAETPDKRFWGSPPLAIMTYEGQWQISVRKTSWNNIIDVETANISVGSYDNDKGKWTNWVVYVRWSSGQDGVLRIWKDGQRCLLVDKEGNDREYGQNKFADDHGNYMKFGIYKWNWTKCKLDELDKPDKCRDRPYRGPSETTQRILYYGELRIADKRGNYEVVAPHNYLTAKHSGKCLDVLGGPSAVQNGTQVIQWDYWGGDNQQWQLIPLGNGYHKIIAKHSGKCLDVLGGPSAVQNDTQVIQWDYWGGDNQHWRLL